MKSIVLIFWSNYLMILVASEDNCNWQNQTINGQQISKVHVEYPPEASFSWSYQKGTQNLQLKFPNHLTVETSITSEKVLVTAKMGTPSSESRIVKGSNFVATLVLVVAWYFFSSRYGFFAGAILICAAVVICSPLDCSKPHIHMNIPFDYVETICENKEKCFPIKCHLSLSYENEQYSVVPSNNEILFSDKYCTIKTPDRWAEWVAERFRGNFYSNDTAFYLADSDRDGLVNILEYYAGSNSTHKISKRDVTILELGTDPLNPDSDGDLLIDGFEEHNGLPPNKYDSPTADDDNDGLSNLEEQIHKTVPNNADTDGDGVSDGEEVRTGSNPTDARDGGRSQPNSKSATVRLTIGDHSGSHSERYLINVGTISHQSPDFGKVGSGNYKFRPGTFDVTIRHQATNLNAPDFDYTASVEKISGDADVIVKDPDSLLGTHDESSYDYTIGKKALLIVTSKCSKCNGNYLESEQDSFCSQCEEQCDYATCDTCLANTKCTWMDTYCGKKDKSNDGPVTCACDACKNWYTKEVQDTRWLDVLNREIRCPCRVTFGIFGTYPVDNLGNEWDNDLGCLQSRDCSYYHPGAHACIRSERTISNAGQQCCYDQKGKIIPAGSPGAGTPDKYGGILNILSHRKEDTLTYTNCCKKCEKKEYCDYYIKGVRMGDTSNCK